MTPEERALRIKQRAERMLERLPRLLQAGPNIQRILEAIGGELIDMERATRLLLESRWYTLARGFDADHSLARKASSDLGSIGALFNLAPGGGESAAYFRDHIEGLVRIHARGLSTARAILELVSFVYVAEQPPAIQVKEGVAVGRFKVRDAGGRTREVRVELIDNPPAPAFVEVIGAQAGQRVITVNAGLDEVRPEIAIKASSRDVAVPVLYHEPSGFDVVFLGVIPSGKTLLLRHRQRPLLDGVDPEGVVVISNPTRFAASATDDHAFRFDAANARFSRLDLQNDVPPIAPGETGWRYRTMSRAEASARFGAAPGFAEHAGKALPEASPPEVDLTFRWDEAPPATFELRIPINYVPPHYQDHLDGQAESEMVAFHRDIQAALEYGRAAGVRATVGMTIAFEPEVMEVDDSLSVEVLEPSVLAVKLTEAVEPPRESALFGGVFDHTTFNESRFEPPDK